MENIFKHMIANSGVKVYFKKLFFTLSDELVKNGENFNGKFFNLILNDTNDGISPVLSWKTGAPRVISCIEFTCTEKIPGDFSFFKNGYQSWTVTRSYRKGETPKKYNRPWYFPFIDPIAHVQDNTANLPSNDSKLHSSEAFAVIKNFHSGVCSLAGQLGPFSDFVYFKVRFDSNGIMEIKIIYDYDRYQITEEGERRLSPLIFFSGTEEDVFDSYFGHIRKLNKIKIKNSLPAGWCSWYYYFNDIRLDDILSNLAVCKRKKLKLDYFQIDDGWQSAVGDWLAMKESFSGRMKSIAEEITGAGYRAGLWIAPFIAGSSSEIFKQHPDWFIRSRSGFLTKFKQYAGFNPLWDGFFYALDITHPDAERYVRRVIRTAVHEWGYDVLKLDFLYAASMPGDCCDMTITRAERLIKGLAIIREEAGPDAFLLGCGSPLMQAIGFVDGMRIGPDIAPYWVWADDAKWGGESHVGTGNSLRNTVTRAAMHKRLWLNDPDCLMVREEGTDLDHGERKMLKDIITASGGMIVISDDLTKLSGKSLKEISASFRLSRLIFKGHVYPVCVMDKSHPDFFLNTAGMLVALNFSDNEEQINIDLEAFKRILKKNKIKIPVRFVDEDGNFTKLNDLATGLKMQGHSSRVYKF